MLSVKDFIDKHKDETIYVAGSGPSLAYLDLDCLKSAPVIAVNSALKKFEGYHNLYFLADDIGVKNWDYYLQNLVKADCYSFLYKDKLKDHISHLNKDKVVFFNHKWWHSPSDNSYNPDGLVFTKDEPIIGARTAAGSAVHLAYILGASKIILLGCDCCYDNLKRYYWQIEKKYTCKRITNEPVFSFPNGGVYKGKLVDKHCLEFEQYWNRLAESASSQGIEILDASDGILSCFEKIKLC